MYSGLMYSGSCKQPNLVINNYYFQGSPAYKAVNISWYVVKDVYNTFVLLNSLLVSIFRHLKLELLTQFPASNDKKCIHL